MRWGKRISKKLRTERSQKKVQGGSKVARVPFRKKLTRSYIKSINKIINTERWKTKTRGKGSVSSDFHRGANDGTEDKAGNQRLHPMPPPATGGKVIILPFTKKGKGENPFKKKGGISA